ncbi:MAG: pseudouridine synthase [Wenzhouxiangellaceae bacterium]|nr:pseudouridine synthase [Wenzhouxiangellaceae bacterium]
MSTSGNTDRPIELLYRDDHLCAVAKPAGILVHRSKLGTDTEFLADRLRDQLGQRVWTVHRLDRATSGVLLVALDSATAAAIGHQFEAGTIAKRYLAIARGWLDEAGEINKPLKVDGGKVRSAVTRWRCLARAELDVAVEPHPTARYSLAELQPLTGRTHQLRRHLNHIAHPIVGDVNHGDRHHNRLFRARFGCHRLLLHAASITLAHPETGKRLDISAPLPHDFDSVIEALGWRDAAPGTGYTLKRKCITSPSATM